LAILACSLANPSLGFGPIGRPLFLAQEISRESPQSLEQGPVRFGTDYLFSLWRVLPWPIPPNPPRSRLGFQQDAGDSVGSDGDADKPPVRHPGDGSGDELAPKTQRFPHPYPPQMGDADAASVEGKLVIGQGKTVMHPLLAELRILCTPRPEVLKGRTQLDDRHLWRVLSGHHPAVSGSCSSD